MADKYVLAKRLGLSAGVFALCASLVVLYLCWFYPQTTVMVLRHAEKATNSNDDSVLLSLDGVARAATFAEVAGRAGVTAIYVTQALRTQKTAEPLATSRGITPTQIDKANLDDLINDVLASKNRGRVIVIIGHSDTVPAIVQRLGGGTVTVGEQFDNLFVLTLNRWGTTRLIQATYGAPR
jgi:phosphohistidine phosphatase SixA